jgi:uncharacterized protein
MKALAASFSAGGLFAIGLGVAGMTQPSKIIAFLDLFGAWDASLALVMASAIAVYFTLHRLIIRRSTPLFDTRFHLPTRKDLDLRLILGAASFGVGWALAGYCPGPGLVSASGGALPAVGFVLSMAVGMKLEQLASQRMTSVRGRRACAAPQGCSVAPLSTPALESSAGRVIGPLSPTIRS